MILLIFLKLLKLFLAEIASSSNIQMQNKNGSVAEFLKTEILEYV